MPSQTLIWHDDRTFDLSVRDYDVCAYFCSSQPSEVLNVDGQPACCDGVFVPSSDGRNTIYFASQVLLDN